MNIPLAVLTNRGALTIHQALCKYLCDDPNGPQWTQAKTAEALGLKHRQEVATHLKRARAAHGESQ